MSSNEQISIGRFSLMTRLSIKALRLYDKKGILVPEFKDNITGYRYYSIPQIEQGIKIKILTQLGFGLNDILNILKSAEMKNEPKLKEIFEKKLHQTRLEIKRLKKIEEILLNNKPMEVLYMNVSEPVIKKVPKLRIISKREKGVYGETIPKLIGEIMQQIFNPDNQRLNVKIAGPIMFISHDKEYKEYDADIEVAVPITGKITADDDFEIKFLPECEVISVIYTGPYENLNLGYQKVFDYALKNKLKIQGLSREIYLNNPQDTEPDKLMTEIQLPIE
ncbi:MAG: MerR family transcriptional regulator, partial [Promethearchaeia archaeon]